MQQWLIRTLAFFGKEMNEVRRQPRLMLSLVLGPVLVLLIFGVGYVSDRPVLPTGLVLPEGMEDEMREGLLALVGLNFQIQQITTEREPVVADLEARALTVVQVMPRNVEEQILTGEQANVEILANTINPLDDAWIQYLAYTQISEINRQLLLSATQRWQQQAGPTIDEMAEARGEFSELTQRLDEIDPKAARSTVRRLRQATTALSSGWPALLKGLGRDEKATAVQQDLATLQEQLTDLEIVLYQGKIEEQTSKFKSIDEKLSSLERDAQLLRNYPPDALVSPLRQSYENISGKAYSQMQYLSPGVLALLLQHLAITLGALTLVRERLRGAVEIFNVTPIDATQVVLGKYLAYMVFIVITGLLLMGSLAIIGVPLPASWPQFVLLIVLLALASLGYGFLLSVLSNSDSQAIQFSMLALLLALFFSGFFIPLENFAPFVQWIGLSMPMTHGIIGLRDLLLNGVDVAMQTWLALTLMVVVTFAVVVVAVRRQFRRADSK
jgi:ABC-2 type transport system permease protein